VARKPDLIASVRRRLVAEGNSARAEAQQAYMKSSMPYAGVAAPGVKAITRDCIAAHPLPDATAWQQLVRALWEGAKYREERYVAIGVARAKPYRPFRTMEALPLYEQMIVEGAWWDFVDDVAINLVGELLARSPKRVAPIMRRWSRAADVWKRRTAIICQLKAKGATDLDLLTDAIEPSLGEKEFFLRKAIGWALREYSKTDGRWVERYVAAKGECLSPLSAREALRVIGKRRAG